MHSPSVGIWPTPACFLSCFVPLVLLLASPVAAVDCADHDIDYPPVLGTLAPAPLVFLTEGLAVEGNYAYISEQWADIGGHAQLSVVDISNPASPLRRGTSGPLGGFAYEVVAVYRQFAYGMTAGIFAISVVNATNPQNPIVMGRFGGNIVGPYDLAIRPESFPNANDARLCFVGVNFRLYAIPGFPSLIGTLAIAGDRVNVAGDHAYVSSASQDALFVIDIVGAQGPSLVGTVPFPAPIGEISDQAIDGEDLYVAADGFVHVFDLSVPAAPAYLTAVETHSEGSLTAAGGLAFLANCCSTTIVSGSGLGSPVFVGTFPTGGAQHVITGDHQYCIGRGGLSIFDVSDLHVAPLVGSLGLSQGTWSVAIQGATAFITSSSWPAYLKAIDISDPVAPVLLGSVGLPLAVDVALSGDHAFAACREALRVVDVSDPSTPQIVAEVPTPIDGDASAVSVTGNLACVTAETAGLLIFDISIPSAPTLIRTVPAGAGSFYDVATAGDYAYVMAAWDGLHVVDLSPPESAGIIGTAPVEAFEGVTAVNGLVYASDDPGVAIIDVTDPTLPSILGHVATYDLPRDIAVHGQFAYASTGHIDVIDISDPTAPVLIANTPTPGFNGWNVAAANDFVVATGYGLFTLPLQCPATTGIGGLSASPHVGWLRAFPNPTQGITTIAIATEDPHGRLGVYDLAGRLVRRLPVAASGGAPRRTVVWDGRDARGRAVAGGAYWLRLEDGAGVRTSKVTVLR